MEYVLRVSRRGKYSQEFRFANVTELNQHFAKRKLTETSRHISESTVTQHGKVIEKKSTCYVEANEVVFSVGCMVTEYGINPVYSR